MRKVRNPMTKERRWRWGRAGFPGPGFSCRPVWSGMAYWLALSVAPGVLYGEEGFGGFEEPASSRTTGLVVGTENPDSLTLDTEDPSSMTVGTTALPEAVGTEAPNTEAGTGANPNSLTVPTESLADSPSGPGFYGGPGEQGKLPDLVPASPQSLEQAQTLLVRAQSRLKAADTAVGNMVRRDYPTGNARLLLYDEQKSAQRDVEQAERWVKNFGG